MSRAIVSDYDLEGNGVTFVGSRVAAGKCFHGDQVSRIVFDNHRFVQIIAGGCRIHLIACRGSGDVGDRVTTVAEVNGAFECQCRAGAGIECSDREQSRCRVVGSLCCTTVERGGSQTCWQQVSQAHVSCLRGSVIGNCDVEGDGVAHCGVRVAAGKCFYSDKIGSVVNDNGFIQIIAEGRWVTLIACRCGGDVGDCVTALAGINGSR